MKLISPSSVTDLRIWAGLGFSTGASTSAAAGAAPLRRSRAACTPAINPPSSAAGTELFDT